MAIYGRAVPINKETHGNLSVKSGCNYSFAKEASSVPLLAAEFSLAASEYAIVFVGNDQSVMPAVVLGTKHKQNLFLESDGTWGARYVPAFMRRYPFVFASSGDGNSLTLCIDEEFGGCNREGLGERLFDAEGERTQYLGSVLDFLSVYQAQFRRTQALCEKLKSMDLLESRRVSISVEGDRPAYVSGFMTVDRNKLKNLHDDQLLELVKSDAMELIYLHLHSLRNIAHLGDRITSNGTLQQEVEASPAAHQLNS